MLETRLWEKEQSHRLFNFHDGYRILKTKNVDEKDRKVPSCLNCLGIDNRDETEQEIIGSNIIRKDGANNIQVDSAHEYKEKIGDVKDMRKLLNIIYHDGYYYLHEPRNKDENEDNIIDNHLWYIVRSMPRKHVEVGLGDVIRFGRIPFKIAKLVLDVKKQQKIVQDEKDELARVIA